MIGEVFGNYRVIAKLGEGGMGAVYLAEHPSIGRKVAIKIIQPAFSNDPETLRRFVREARSTATLRHPSLVDIMDYGVHEPTGSAYIIMEYLEGESLDTRLERVGKLDPVTAAAIARQIALGMAAAHRAGIIHRDLKPGNVHLVADPDRPGVDVVKVLDFGIAKLANNDTGAGPTTRTDVLLGTPRYMAPEQCRGGGVLDHRADIYSLGCLLYEALSGQPPFAHQWPGELIAAHISETPLALRARDATVPAPLEALVMRALAKNPAHRQQTMNDVARELEHFLGIEVSVPPMALAPSAAPPRAPHLSPAGPVHANARAGSPTTTASVVMPKGSGRGFPVRGTLIAAGALVPVGILILVIATRKAVKAPTPLAMNADDEIAAEPAARPSPAAKPAELPLSQPLHDDPERALAASGAPDTPNAVAAAPGSAPEGAREMPAPSRGEPEDPPAPASAVTGSSPASTAPKTAGSETASAIRITVANPRPGIRVTLDGRSIWLPNRFPRDQKAHVLAFTVPNFKPETKTVVFDQDRALTLEYRPKLYVP